MIQQNDLDQFIGTTQYHKLTLFGKCIFTDGCAFVAEKCGAFWLFQDIELYIMSDKKLKNQDFLSVTLKKFDDNHTKAKLIFDDGNKNRLRMVIIEFTDFPLEKINFFISKQEENSWVCMLPSEY